MNDQQLVMYAFDWAEKNPNFLDNFRGLIYEYGQFVKGAGIDIETLPSTKACLIQVNELFDGMGLEVSNG